MKYFSFFLITLSIFSFNIQAQQQIEITPQVGYMFTSKAYYYQGSISVKDNISYGLTIGLPVSWDTYGEFTYTRSEAQANFFSTKPDYNDDEFLVASNYFLLNANKQVGNDNIRGFGGLSFGAVWYDIKDTQITDVWRFSFGFGGGAKIYLNELLGLRLQARLLFPLYLNGGGMYYGIGGGGSGGGVYMSSTGTVVQTDLSAGLIFQLGEFY